MRRAKLVSSAVAISVASILGASRAAAQTPPSSTETAEGELATVTVSSSRIQRQDGFDAPTPVAVIGSEALNREARIDVADLIRQMPAFGSSSSPSNARRCGRTSTSSA